MSITPQGYNYGVKPNTIHPFWGGDSGETDVLKFYDVTTPHAVLNTDSTFQTITLTADTTIFNLVQPPISVSANDEVYVPFVYKEKTLYLFGKATDSNTIKWTGVYSPFETDVEVRLVTTQEVSLPDIQATAEVDSNVGTPSVDVTNNNNVLNFSFKNLKGEKGEKGEKGDTGERGAQGEQGVQGVQGEQGEQGKQGMRGKQGIPGEPGVTPDITVNATVDETTGTPSVSVNKSGTADSPIFDLAFSGLKGGSASGGGLTRVDLSESTTIATINLISGIYFFPNVQLTLCGEDNQILNGVSFNGGLTAFNLSDGTFAFPSVGTYTGYVNQFSFNLMVNNVGWGGWTVLNPNTDNGIEAFPISILGVETTIKLVDLKLINISGSFALFDIGCVPVRVNNTEYLITGTLGINFPLESLTAINSYSYIGVS